MGILRHFVTSSGPGGAQSRGGVNRPLAAEDHADTMGISELYPIGSMYGIYANIGGILMAHTCYHI